MSYTYYRRYKPSKRHGSFKSFFWLVLALVLVFLLLRACIYVVTSISAEQMDEAVLSVSRGSAEVLEWGQTEPKSASDTELVLEGDQVSTGAGSFATLTFFDGSLLYLDENTKLRFSGFEQIEDAFTMTIELLDGRLWVSQTLVSETPSVIQLRTDVMNLSSVQGEYFVSNQVNNEFLAVKSGQVDTVFVDRGTEDIGIESGTFKENEYVFLDDVKERALLNRENVTLIEVVPEVFWQDTFVLVATSDAPNVDINADVVEEEAAFTAESAVAEESATADEPTAADGLAVTEAPAATEEPVVTEETTALKISVISPASSATIQKDAIAIEGQIVSGTASKVTVTWSGSGQPYTLTGYVPGSSSFRYVADIDYSNFAVGENTYTITAYDEAGNPSNTVTVTLIGEF